MHTALDSKHSFMLNNKEMDVFTLKMEAYYPSFSNFNGSPRRNGSARRQLDIPFTRNIVRDVEVSDQSKIFLL